MSSITVTVGTVRVNIRSRFIRETAGLRPRDNRPIDVVDGDTPPTLVGQTWHYTTKSGRRVHHPGAYKRVAKSADLVYVGSSRTVIVGRDWLLARAWTACR